MRISHIVFIIFCISFVVLTPLTINPEYVEKYGYYSSMGEMVFWLIPAIIFYYMYLKFEKKRQKDPTIKK